MKKTILALTLLATSFTATADWTSSGRSAWPSNNTGAPVIQFFEQKGYGEFASINRNKNNGEVVYYYDILVDGKRVEYIPCEEGCGAGEDAIIENSTIKAMMKGSTVTVKTDLDGLGKTYSLKGSAKALRSARKNRYKF